MSSLYELDPYRVAGSGDFSMGTAGETLGNRKLVYLGANGNWYLADADTVAKMDVVGITMHAIGPGFKGWILHEGFIGLSTWTWVVDSKIYASATAGELTQTAPAGVGDTIQVVGGAVQTTQIYFNPGGGGGGGAGCAVLEGATAYVGFDECKEPYANYFLCDGVADDVQINLAMVYVNGLGGGSVFIERGFYRITAVITVPPNIEVVGTGTDTILQGADDINIFDVNIGGLQTLGLCGIRNMRLTIEGTMVAIRVDNVWLFKIENIFFDAKTTSYETAVQFINNAYISQVNGCEVADFTVYGVTVGDGCHGIVIEDNIFSPDDGAIIIDVNQADAVKIVHNWMEYDAPDGGTHIHIDDCNETTVSDNILAGGDATSYGLHVENVGSQRTQVQNNIFSMASGVPIYFEDASKRHHITNNQFVYGGTSSTYCMRIVASDVVIANNVIRPQANVSNNIVFIEGGSRALISSNIISAEALRAVRAIRVAGGADSVTAHNNTINNIQTGISWAGVSETNGVIQNNTVIDATTGVDVGPAVVGCRVFRNKFVSCTTNISDAGTDTQLAVASFQFTEPIVGTISVTSPTGVDVDATTEGALAWGQLPDEVQQIVRLKIWAVATDGPIGTPGQMHLEVIFNAGASNAAYNEAAKSWTITDFDGEETDYVADDVVHWVIEDGDVGNELLALVAGDSFEIFAMWEVGDDPDGATDAVFRVVEVEYV